MMAAAAKFNNAIMAAYEMMLHIAGAGARVNAYVDKHVSPKVQAIIVGQGGVDYDANLQRIFQTSNLHGRSDFPQRNATGEGSQETLNTRATNGNAGAGTTVRCGGTRRDPQRQRHG
eukprot:gene10994-35624_t